MKKRINLSLLALTVSILVSLVGCKKPPVVPPPYDGVDTTDIIVGFVGYFDGEEIRFVENDTVVVDSIRIFRNLQPEPDTSFSDYLSFLTRISNNEQIGIRKSFTAYVGTNAPPYEFYNFFTTDTVKWADTVNLVQRLIALDTMSFNNAQISLASIYEDIKGITVWYKDTDTILYTSSSGPQVDSYFAFQEIDSLNTVLGKDAVRFKAKFACTLYGTNGKRIEVTDGYYIGTFRNFE